MSSSAKQPAKRSAKQTYLAELFKYWLKSTLR